MCSLRIFEARSHGLLNGDNVRLRKRIADKFSGPWRTSHKQHDSQQRYNWFHVSPTVVRAIIATLAICTLRVLLVSVPSLIVRTSDNSTISACTNVSPADGLSSRLSESRSLYRPANSLRSCLPTFPAAPVIKTSATGPRAVRFRATGAWRRRHSARRRWD